MEMRLFFSQFTIFLMFDYDFIVLYYFLFLNVSCICHWFLLRNCVNKHCFTTRVSQCLIREGWLADTNCLGIGKRGTLRREERKTHVWLGNYKTRTYVVPKTHAECRVLPAQTLREDFLFRLRTNTHGMSRKMHLSVLIVIWQNLQR